MNVINEYESATGRMYNVSSDLPDPAEFVSTPYVKMTREQLVRFRNDYLLFKKFAAFICGKRVDEVTPWDLKFAVMDALRDEHEMLNPQSEERERKCSAEQESV